MSMRFHVNCYFLNMALCRWSPCHSIKTYMWDEKDVITCYSHFWGFLAYISVIAVLSHQYSQDMFHTPCFWCSPRGSSLLLQDRQAACAGNILKTSSESAWKHWPENLHGKSVLYEHLLWTLLCMVTVSMKVLLSGQAVLNFKFCRVFLALLILPTCLILQY
jgi:uncharacterized membrane protein